MRVENWVKKIIGGNLILGDWKLRLNDDKIVNKISKKVRDGSIIILHDYLEDIGEYKRIASLTEKICSNLKKKKYNIVKVFDVL